jgi:hypothetical protein
MAPRRNVDDTPEVLYGRSRLSSDTTPNCRGIPFSVSKHSGAESYLTLDYVNNAASAGYLIGLSQFGNHYL